MGDRGRLRFKVVPGNWYGTPKELWGFRAPPAAGSPEQVAVRFLLAHTELLGLKGLGRDLAHRKTLESAGAHHVIFSQRLRGVRIHRAYVTVHLDRARRVYLVKNRAVPADRLPPRPAAPIAPAAAVQVALWRATRGAGPGRVTELEPVWFPAKSRLYPAYKVRVRCERPRAEWIVYVDAVTGRVRSAWDNLASAAGRARVFDPNPVVAVPGWDPLGPGGRPRRPPAAAYREVALAGLAPGGWLGGVRVTTAPTRGRVRRPDGRFLFESTERGFDEAMAYFHVDRAIRYLESLGYRGARAIFREPVPVNAHGTREDNSWYSPAERSLTFGTGGVDDAEDAETILHELGHAIQDAICPDFGQSAQAAAMGEGFGDYFAASFFAGRKPERFRTSVASWDCVTDTRYDPPCLRRVDGAETFESFDPDGDEHDNGPIWSATLWDLFEAVGREAADRTIVESHFQLDGFTSFARGARAILDADRNLFGGRHLAAMRRVFRRRGIGPVE
ncbi:MAG: M4 family metallopeptidase [Acidobacteria bacterium]|jgi:hypothetical protein|nr:M4 family metallopeptidase [Acidobacteriota bacterium]